MRYSIRYSVWNIEAENIVEAKKKAVDMMKNGAEYLISVEIPQPKHGVLFRLLTGR